MAKNSYTPPAMSVAEMFLPRKRHFLSIPLAPGAHAELDVPVPMTEAHWQQMLAVLETMKPGLVRQELPQD